MILRCFNHFLQYLYSVGQALFFFMDVMGHILCGRIRWGEVLKQIYEQGVQSIVIIAMTSFASGAVLALQGFVMLSVL